MEDIHKWDHSNVKSASHRMTLETAVSLSSYQIIEISYGVIALERRPEEDQKKSISID